MANQIATNFNTLKVGRSKPRTIIVCLMFGLSLAAVFALQQSWWTFFFLAEIAIALGAVEVLAWNLPKKLQRQIKINSHRSDGSQSAKRKQLEISAIRRFKLNTLICFAFTLIPLHACWFTYCFFIPQINRFKEHYEPATKHLWTEFFLEPSLHIAILIFIFALLTYDSLRAVYLMTLKELDEEVCRRAENYAVYDLVNPPTKGRQVTSA